MSDKVDTVYNIWHSHDNYLGKRSVTPAVTDVAHYFANLFCLGDYYYYVIDSPTLTFDVVSPSTTKLLGISPDELSLPRLINLIHPDDVTFMMRCEDVVAYFLKHCVSPEKMVKYKITYCLRERTVHKGYRMFLLQTITMKTTEDGALLKVFGCHTDITHITSVNNRKLSLIGLDGEPSCMDMDVFDENIFENYEPFDLKGIILKSPYSRREIEIIKYLALGMTTDAIAEKLCVSRNTVETHRKNMLKKSKCKNTAELVAQCIRAGYV